MPVSMLEKLVLPEVRELIEARDFPTLREALRGWLPVDWAALVEDLSPESRTWVFRSLDDAAAARVFSYLEFEAQEQLVESLPAIELTKILNGMAPDDRTALLEELPTDRTQRLLSLLSVEERRVSESLLAYPEDSVGRLMTPDYLAVKEHWTVPQVLEYVRTYGKDSETLNDLFVTDDRGRLIDDIRMREVLLAPLSTKMRDLMHANFVSLSVTEDKREAVETFRTYDRTALPVTNDGGILVGVVTVDDVLDVAEEEATRDMQRLGGMEALEEAYSATPLTVMIRKRAVWLIILFIGEMLTATAMGYFEAELDQAVVLALFVPLIISSGGNSGSQASTLIVRALGTGDVALRQWGFVLRRELISGATLGGTLGAIGFLRIALWSAFSNIYGPHWLLVGFTVGTAVTGVVLWGVVTGAMLPFVLKRLGLDPATSSAPFVATLVDVTGLLIYFGAAITFLRGTLL